MAFQVEVRAELCPANVASVLAHSEVEFDVLDDVCVLTEKFVTAVESAFERLFSRMNSEVVFVVACLLKFFSAAPEVAAEDLGNAFGLLTSHFVDF